MQICELANDIIASNDKYGAAQSWAGDTVSGLGFLLLWHSDSSSLPLMGRVPG